MQAHDGNTHSVAGWVSLATVDQLAGIVSRVNNLGKTLVVARVAETGGKVERVANERALASLGVELVEAERQS